jgi:hypothetical protein
VLGTTSSGDFPQVNPLAPPVGTNNGAFLARLDATGLALLYSTYLGGSGVDVPTALFVGAAGEAVFAGTGGAPMSEGRLAKVTPILGPTAVPLLTGLTPGSDSGASAFDRFTSNVSPTLRGLAAPGSAVRVNADDLSVVGMTVADAAGVWTLTAGAQAEGTYAYTVSRDAPWGTNNRPSAAALITVDQTAPVVTLQVPATTTDPAPTVFVRAADRNGLPDGTPVFLDIDRNADGDYTDPGEASAAQGLLHSGFASLILPSLALGAAVLRARVADRAGNEGQTTAGVQLLAVSDPWQLNATVRTADVGEGLPDEQLGDARAALDLDLDLSPGRAVALSPQLVYSSAAADPRPVVQATLSTDSNQALPPVVRAVLTWDGIAQPEQVFDTTGLLAGQSLTLAVRPVSAVTLSGRHTGTCR